MDKDMLLSTLVPSVIILLGWCTKLLTEIVKAKVSELQSKTNNDTIKTYVDIVSDNAVNVVETLNQTLVGELKSAHEDGKLTNEEIIHIRDTAINMLADTLSDDVKEVIGKVFCDLNAYLSNVIEKTVVAVKKK